MTDSEFVLSDAIALYLKNYPGKNDSEFAEVFRPEYAPTAKAAVHEILEETMRIRPDWSHMSLNDAGDYVEEQMHARHPDFSPKALACLGNYFTYLMR